MIGASDEPGTVGGEVARNLRAAGFPGPLHLLAGGGALAGVEGEVELAVIAVAADAVVDAARACAAKGVRALVVLTAGVAEAGELLAVCRAAGMRMVGPDSLGVACPSRSSLNATFAPVPPPPGSLGFAAQSGGFGIAAIDEAAARGIGFSSFVSMGDKADLSGNDFLEYWEQDAGHRGAAALPGVVREPAPVRADRAADHAGPSRSWRSRAAAGGRRRAGSSRTAACWRRRT